MPSGNPGPVSTTTLRVSSSSQEVRSRVNMQSVTALNMSIDFHVDSMMEQSKPVVLLMNVGALVQQPSKCD